MEPVGYKLIDIADGSVVETWGGNWGSCPAQPNPVVYPNGDIVYGLELNTETNGYKLVLWEVDPPSPTVDNVAFERNVRLAVGFYYDFSDARGVHHIGTTEADMVGWADVSTWANSQIALNKTDTVTIVTDTGPVSVSALDWMHILDAAGSFRQPIWAASFALENQNPIPQDYKDNKYWPPAPVNPNPPPPEV